MVGQEHTIPPTARLLVVSGRVQGVFFRAATRHTAQRHGVCGWARNRDDGAVEIWLEGDPDAVEAVEAWVHAGGPPAAQVVDVDVETVEPIGADTFEVLR
jgi:acylphosphatase